MSESPKRLISSTSREIVFQSHHNHNHSHSSHNTRLECTLSLRSIHEAISNGKLNGTHSKSVIINGPNGKQVTQQTSVFTTSRSPSSNGSFSRNATSEPQIAGRSKSTSPTRRTISPPQIGGGSHSPDIGADTTAADRPPSSSSTFQTNVNVRTHSKSPSPIRSSTTVESTWKSSLRNGAGSGTDQSSPIRSAHSQPQHHREYRHQSFDGDTDSYRNFKSSSATEHKNFDTSKRATTTTSTGGQYSGRKSSSPTRIIDSSYQRPLSSASTASASWSPHRSSSRDRDRRVRISDNRDSFDTSESKSVGGGHHHHSGYSKQSTWSSSDGVDKSREEHTSTIEMPIDGWSLKDAVKSKMLNPRSGSRSTVPSTASSRSMSLSRALNRGILDDNGHYINTPLASSSSPSSAHRKMNLEEAIDRKYITYDDLVPTSGLTATRIVRIIKTDGSSDVTLEPYTGTDDGTDEQHVESIHYQTARHSSSTTPIMTDRHPSSSSQSQSSSATHHHTTSSSTEKLDSKTKYEEYVEIGRNIFYSPSSDTVIDESSGERMSLKEALEGRLIDENKFSIIDTITSEPLTLVEAKRKNLLDSIKYTVKDSKRSKILPISEAVKRGLFVLSSSPFALMDSAYSAYSTTLSAPHDENSAIDSESLPIGGGRVVRETVQVLKSREVLIKDPATGREMSIEEALRRGIIDKARADELRSGDQDGFSVHRSVGLTVHDPRTGRAIPIDEAVSRGIIDEATASRIRRGEVIENVIKTNVTVVDDETENWSDIVSEINQRLDLIQEFRQFQEAYTSLKRWLNETEKQIKTILSSTALDRDSIEPLLDHIQILRQDFRSHEKSLQTVDETGRSCQSRMDHSSIEYSRIEKLITTLHTQWDHCLASLAESESKMKEMRDVSEKYFEKVTKIDRELESIRRELDSLAVHRQEVSQKERKLETIQEKLTRQRTSINECESICDQMCSLTTESSIRSEIRNQFNELDRKHRELARDIREMSSFLRDYHHFELKAEELESWQKQTESFLKSDLKISTEERILREEMDRVESILKDMKSKEVEFEKLIDMSRDVSKQAISSESYECKQINSTLDEIEKRWIDIRKSCEQRKSRLEKGMSECKRITSQLTKFSSWMDNMEVEVSNLQDIVCEKSVVEKQMSEVRKIMHEISDHSDEYRKVSEISLSCFDVGVNQAREEIETLKKRWESLNKSVDQRYRQLDQVSHKLIDYEEMLRETRTIVARFEEKIDSTDVMKSVHVESKMVDRAKSLIDESESINRKLDRTHEKATSVAKEVKHGSERIMEEIESLANHFELMVKNLKSRYSEMKSVLNSVQQFMDRAESFQRRVAKEESIVSSLSTIASDVHSLEQQTRELNDLMEESSKMTKSATDIRSAIEQESSKFSKSFETSFRHIIHMIESSESRHEVSSKVLHERKIKIEQALKEAREYEQELQEFEQWLSSSEREISKLEEASFLAENIEKQMEETRKFQEKIDTRSAKLTELERRAPKQNKELLVTIRHRINKLSSKCTERSKALDRNLKQAREFLDKWSSMMDWLSQAESIIESNQTISGDTTRISSMLAEIRSLSREFDSRHAQYESVSRMGRSLKDKSPRSDAPVFQKMLDELRTRWSSALDSCNETQKRLEKARNSSEKFQKSIERLKEWISRCNISTDHLHGDVETVQRLIKEHSNFHHELKQKTATFESVKITSEELMSSVSLEETKSIRNEVAELEQKFKQFNQLAKSKDRKLDEALRKAEQFKLDTNRMMEWLSDMETSIARMDSVTMDRVTIERHLSELDKYSKEMSREEVNRDRVIADGQSILLDCHPDAEIVIRRSIKLIESRWQEVSDKLRAKETKLRDALNNIVKKLDSLEDLLKWLRKMEKEMRLLDSKPVPDDTGRIQELIDELNTFKDQVMSKEREMDSIVQEYRIDAIGRRSHARSGLTRIRARDVQVEQIADSKAQEIIERWQNILRLIDDRMRRLRDQQDYYLELEKLRDFDFNEWRQRFLDWMNQRKAKLMDFYRKLDADHDNLVNYEDFINGFLRSGFPTSRAEMQKVVTVFDRNKDSFVDNKEWLDTLRDKSEAEIIKDEVHKQVAKCQCMSKYKVYQVEDRKYRFGESQKLRLVRILRSTVMVRVGGGWVTLDEFLVKNDPCRAKGRTNVELREPLAEGVSQSIATFRPKSPFVSSIGPITKIREKTERSLPMSRSFSKERGSRDSLNGGDQETRPASRLTFGVSDGRTSGRSSRADDFTDDSLDMDQQQQRRGYRSTSRTRK
ncbi:uncharacterized protein LOC141850140 isoform X2 [Brevipalpus obovatus]|uniref:uncharacterized protein LOC141850140 isoform X2 n=1 Tax=Brevipalpus obovatus TaxID=246614 RepID=UPI003D9E06EC